MVFSGYESQVLVGNYTPKAINRDPPPLPGSEGWWYNYNNGVGVYRYANGTDAVITTYFLYPNQNITLNHDATLTGDQNASFGYGIYKVVLSDNPDFEDVDSILIDYDWRDGHGDNEIHYYNDSVIFKLAYCDYPLIKINYDSEDNYFIKPWKRCDSTRNYGNAKYDTTGQNTYVEFPLDSRKDCYVLPGIAQNQIFKDSRSGNIPLNMTVYKDINTRDTLVDTNTNIVVLKKVYLIIKSGKTFKMTTPVVPSNGSTNLIIQDSALLLLEVNSKIIVGSPNKFTLSNQGQVTLWSNAELIFEPGSYYCNLRGRVKGPGKMVFNNGYHLICTEIVDFILEDSAKLVLADSAEVFIPDNSTIKFNGSQTALLLGIKSKLRLGDNSKLIFEGADCYLNAKSNSSILFGDSASIVFKNGAYIRANGVTFNADSTNEVWDGLVFENSGLDSISNCTFSKARTSISIKNDSVSLANSNNNIITGNTFNISQTNGRGIDARDVFNLLLDNNTFDFSSNNGTIGLYFRNIINGSAYSLNVTKNIFVNGYIPLYLSCLAADKTPFYIYKNEFYGENIYSIAAQKISGDIKKNIFDIYNPYSSIGLWNCNANIFENSIYSYSLNMYLNYSYPVLAPTRDENNYTVWTGGRNDFSSEGAENILSSTSLPSLYLGKNSFSIYSSSPYHIFGSFPDTNILGMKYNCWFGHYDSAKFYSYKYVNDTVLKQIPGVYLPKWCSASLDVESPIIINKGNGVYDTVEVTEDVLPAIDDDEAFLIQARSDYRRHVYSDAITNYKGLIDNYTSSPYLYTSLSELYDCYESLDTSGNQNTTDILFGELKGYLEDKIISDSYDTSFEDAAFSVTLMSETNMEDFEAALTGYEFMALYHPDAEQRILASWDYDDINELIGEGAGGGERAITNFKLQITNKEQELIAEQRELKRLNKKINDDPILKSMKKRYEKSTSGNNQKQKGIITNSLKDKMDGYARQRQCEKLISRAKENVLRSKYLPKEEKDARRIEDIKILTGENKTEIQTDDIITSQPVTYSLSQNYPNPFNPTTTISYSLPKSGLINITVYDITGKEVAKLVNEFKEAGSYDVIFSAANLSSGIYFYKIQAGAFIQTKRMVLLK